MFKKSKPKIIFGRHPILEAVQNGTSISKLMLQTGTKGEFEKELRHALKGKNIPIQYVPKEKLNRVTGKNHQGVIGFIALVDFYKLEDVLPQAFEQPTTPLFLLLDSITDVRNVGAIARSAEIAGVTAMIIPQKGFAEINADAIKASAGALTSLTLCRETSIAASIDLLQLSGVKVIASDLKAEKLIDQVDMKDPLAIVIGSEGEGVSYPILRKADDHFIIPQKGTIDSFNVSVATGIMLYEVMRQRGGQ